MDEQLTIDLPGNREPWLVDFKVRFREFFLACRESKLKRVVLIYDAPNTSSFRYRVYNVKQALDGNGQIHISYFYRYELPSLKPYVSKIDLMVFSRCQWTLEIQDIYTLLKNNRIPIVFDIDDLFCDLDQIQLITNTLNVELNSYDAYTYWSASISRTFMVAKMADYYIATNAYLGQKLSRQFQGKPYYVIENSLNREQVQISEEICRKKRLHTPDKSRFIMGYFSGTPSHINDFKIIAPEIMELLHNFPEMILRVVGFMDFPEYMNKMREQGRIEFRPLVDFMELQVEMGQVDLNIVPLVDNEFTNCKSELKFFEASVVDTLTCATPIYSYAHSIRHGSTGFLCRPGEWYRTIADIFQGRYDTEKILAEAKTYCLDRYYGANFKNQALQVFNDILTRSRKQIC
ncbi:MAG: hypothetical protein J5858_12655 [Lentisphaeria bacterium]|nr:hypothetical protein [Lentisphaeria bacterium]